MKLKHYDVVIIGGGPAGCSCALWLKHLGLKPLIVERSECLGGLQNFSPYPNVWILGRNYSNGKAFAREVSKQITGEKIEVRFNTETSDFKYVPEKKVFDIELKKMKTSSRVTASYVVLATGVVANKGGFESSSNILIGPGPHIEKPQFRNRTVAILGGGDNAFENYQFIQKQRPKSIKIFARHVRAQLPFVTKIKKGELFVGTYNVDKENRTVNGKPFDFLVVMYGWSGVNALENFVTLKSENSYILTDSHRRTSENRIYAIGELTQSAHPCCVTAMADGIIAAKDIQTRMDSERVPEVVRRKI